jgi:hypothetical protein
MREEVTTYRLSCQVNSFLRPQHIYGRQGEQIELIAKHGDVWIVRGECGTFPVEKKYVTDMDVGDLPTIGQNEFVPQKAPTKKSSKSKPITQTLF